ncbi:MAG: penicillin-binding protein 2 [Pseudomonadota bacterium]
MSDAGLHSGLSTGLRIPLRPLSRILRARERGENPDAIERENLAARHEAARDTARERAEGRLLLVAMCFFAGFLTVALRMGALAAAPPVEPILETSDSAIISARADILDASGRILATNHTTQALYAHPHQLYRPDIAAARLAEIFPGLEEEQLAARFGPDRRFAWIRRNLSPEQQQAVYEIGDPGLHFGPREMRLYPNGALASHVLGAARFGQEGVDAAEVVGAAGIEAEFDAYLRDPTQGGAPLRLSLDLSVQAAVEEVLAGGIAIMHAVGGSAVLMDAHTGEIVAMASQPDYDPNAPPLALADGAPDEDPLFNRAVQGVYELGSVFKAFTIAQALELGLVNPSTIFEVATPLRSAGHVIEDYKPLGPELSVEGILVESSNIGTGHIARMIGGARQRDFLTALGLTEVTDLELIEAASAAPILPPHWNEPYNLTVSYGHGLAISPVSLAAGYATLVNGGYRVTPSLLAQDTPQRGEQVISEATSAQMRALLRAVVAEGTASMADIEGYHVGGKTGTADLPRPEGGYYDDRNLATFAAAFPMTDPEYVLVVTLDQPWIEALGEVRRTAGWTTVPVTGEIISRVAPLLGLRPDIASPALDPLTGAQN